MILNTIRPFHEDAGHLLIRMEKLFYTQELEAQRVTAWREEARGCRKWPSIDPGTLGDLDRIWVVVLTGKLAGCAEEVCRLLRRAGRHSMLLGMIVSPEADQLQRIYLGPRTNCIGVLHTGGHIQLDFDAVEYQPTLERMLRLLKIDATVSPAAIRTVRGLVDPDQGLQDL